VIGEEVDVAGRLVEVVGAEALVDLGREDFFPFVELHDDLHDVTDYPASPIVGILTR
jgi:hypothetical protein